MSLSGNDSALVEGEDSIVNRVHSNVFHFIEDIVVQEIHANWELDPSAQTGSDLPADGFTLGAAHIEENALPEHLDSGQVAELIQFERGGVQPYYALASDTTFATEPGVFMAEVEVQDLDRAEDELDVTTGDVTTNHGNIGDASASDFQTTVAYTEIDQAAHDHCIVAATQPWADKTVAGSGGGSAMTSSAGTFIRNYRQDFGRGPIWKPDGASTLQMAYSMFWWNVANVPMGVNARYRAFWDIYEYEERDLRDVPGRK